MLKNTRALLLTVLLAMTLAFSPAVVAQEAPAQPAPAEDNSTRNQLIFAGAAVIIMIVYVKRRKKRTSK